MDVDALYFIIICVEELLSENTQRGSQNNPSRSLSPGNPLYKTPSKRVVYSTKDHQESETPATLLHSASSKDYFSPIPNKDRESLPKPKKFESFSNRNYNSYSPQKMPYLTDSHERVKKGNEKIGDKKSKLNEDNELNSMSIKFICK